MPEGELFAALVAVGDIDLRIGEARPASVDVRARSALQRELEREHRRGGPRTRRAVRLRMRRAIVVPLCALLVAALGAVGYAALTQSSTASQGIDCHVGATLGGSGTVTHLDGGSAIAACERLWSAGAVADGAHAPPAPLHACVATDGKGPIHVLASADAGICARLGLREQARAGSDPAAQRYGRFAAAIARELDRPAFACPAAAQLRALVAGQLRASGLSGWTITDTGGYDAAQPCASLALDSDRQTATISPVPR